MTYLDTCRRRRFLLVLPSKSVHGTVIHVSGSAAGGPQFGPPRHRGKALSQADPAQPVQRRHDLGEARQREVAVGVAGELVPSVAVEVLEL